MLSGAVLGSTPEIGREVARDLERHVREAAARFGVAGEVRVADGSAWLDTPGGSVSVGAGSLMRDWARLSLEDRRWAATGLARSLVERRRALGLAVGGRPPSLWIPVGIVLGVAGILLAAAFAYPLVFPAPTPSASPTAVDPDSDRLLRARRVCAETRARIARGATAGPTDSEGWVVELTLLRRSSAVALQHDPGLGAFLERTEPDLPTHIVWSGAPSLARRDPTAGHVVLSGVTLPARAPPRWDSVTLTFTGSAAALYFQPAERGDFFALATAACERLGIDFAGLFARCDGSIERDIGTWFRGPTGAGAAAGLLYFMATTGGAPQVAPEHLARDDGSLDPTRVLDELPPLGRDLDRERLGSLLAASGGMVSGARGGPFTITFPFERSDRASLASAHCARFFGVAAAP